MLSRRLARFSSNTGRNQEMILNLKVLGLALVAVFATSALIVSAAQATNAAFEADSTTVNAKYKIEQDGNTETGLQTIETEFGNIECQTFTGNGTVAKKATEVTFNDVHYTGHQFQPESTACEAFGLEAEINFNSCALKFLAGTLLAPGESTGTLDLECPENRKIEINAAGLCTVFIPAQNGLSHVIFHQVNPGGTAKSYVTAEATLTNITYWGEGLLCAGHFGQGVYVGYSIITAFNDNPVEAAVNATIVSD
jgi:hypothetical protein